MKDLNCPYCEKELEVCHDDGFGYEQAVKHEMECSYCGKKFVFQTTISFYYEPQKADCLNDDKHNYQLTPTYPTHLSKMRCQMCDCERELTEDERKRFNIGTREEYLELLKSM